jgi:FkbM family methyltransferase
MLYRFQKYSRMRRFSYAIREVFRTPPVEVKEAPWCIVSMVANGDVAMYLLAIKSFYPKLGRGKVAAIIDRDMPQALRDTLARHVIGLEFVILEHIPTGACQRGGTWERLLYVLDRSEREYTIQLDSDTLTVSDDVDEVVHCLEVNTSFTISDGFEIMSLPEVAQEAEVTPSEYIGIVSERMFAHYPDGEHLRYVRGSSGFAGFSRGGFSRAALTDFHKKMDSLVGAPRWREWGSEQCGSNFAIANSPGAIVLPRPEYASFTPRVPRNEVKFFHFIGSFRFLDGYYAARGREVIARLRTGVTTSTVANPTTRDDRLPLAFTRTLRPVSGLKYLTWQVLGRPYALWLRSRSGPEFQLRPRGESNRNNDVGVAYEIFVHRYYVPPIWIPPERVRLITDLGANVGLSCLYFLATYWAARVIAFEPHPDHAAQFHLNVARNRFTDRVTLHEAAAGTANARAWISDEGSSSQLSVNEGEGYQIDVVDVFPLLAGRRVDILKMDIEGSEYELLEDPRFCDLDVRALVMEWHPRANRSSGQEWCSSRLQALGFRVYPVFGNASCGMLWAYKVPQPSAANALDRL